MPPRLIRSDSQLSLTPQALLQTYHLEIQMAFSLPESVTLTL